MNPNIRPLVEADLAALARLQAMSFDEAWSAAEIESLASAAGGFAMTAVTQDRPIGFLVGRATAGEAEIITVAVDPGRRRAGVGRALVGRALEVARGLGAESLFLEVAVDNTAALSLYEAAGFTRAGFRAGYYQRKDAPPADALVLRRDLTG